MDLTIDFSLEIKCEIIGINREHSMTVRTDLKVENLQKTITEAILKRSQNNNVQLVDE